MASEKQDRANRLNAQKSTGPKTPQGRAAVRLNVAKHGILSKDSLLPGEDEAPSWSWPSARGPSCGARGSSRPCSWSGSPRPTGGYDASGR